MIPHSDFWLLVTGFWLLVTGFWLLVTGCWFLASCPMRHALCPLRLALCPLPYAPCPMRHALKSDFRLPTSVLCSLSSVLRLLIGDLLPIPQSLVAFDDNEHAGL